MTRLPGMMTGSSNRCGSRDQTVNGLRPSRTPALVSASTSKNMYAGPDPLIEAERALTEAYLDSFAEPEEVAR